MASPVRKVGETLSSFKARRHNLNNRIKRLLQGRLIWDSRNGTFTRNPGKRLS